MQTWVKEGRAGENIGGGFFVFRRGDGTNRISPPKSYPFEHATIDRALAEADRLAKANPGHRFDVIGVVASRSEPVPAPELVAAE